ncbi:50S ribosomal protein L13 [Bdellovibrio sp. HCB274]|uniref:50S ribosomal protein L13 n=1 Tax=Bdellovibrio sp. HCB274 TaxID=3394361 RepID=UPI0039B5E5F0
MKTFNAKAEEVERKWLIVDAADQKVGRVATHVANILRGKNKAIYTPNVDTGDFVIVINTDKMELSGTKWDDKKYYRHSRFFGSMKEMTAAQAKEKDSTFIIHEAVRGMLPTNKLSRHIIMKMKTYAGAEHPHAAQKPEVFTLPTKK